MDKRISGMAGRLAAPAILAMAADVRAHMERGHAVCNLTVGDFASAEFPIPEVLQREIVAALAAGATNYPPADGVLALRQAIARFYWRTLGLETPLETILVTSGSRPGLFGTYAAIVDPGDTVVYPVPSWHNNHYIELLDARGVAVPCDASTAFLPTRAKLEPVIRGARLLALNSPLNPCGTVFREEVLAEICDLVLEENARRGPDERPLYLMYDMVYWMLTVGGLRNPHPVRLRPAMAAYTVTVDGISKAFAATGVRVGWTLGPADITREMSAIVTHVGAWAPTAEQIATARLLDAPEEIEKYHGVMLSGIQARLDAMYSGIQELAGRGFPVEAIPPMGAMYLSVRFGLHGMRTADGRVLETDEDVRRFLLESAGIGVVPFGVFGVEDARGWSRVSVGAVSLEGLRDGLARLERALEGLVKVGGVGVS